MRPGLRRKPQWRAPGRDESCPYLPGQALTLLFRLDLYAGEPLEWYGYHGEILFA